MYYHRRRATKKATPGSELSIEILDLALELHDIRDTSTNLKARENDVRDRLIGLLDNEGLVPKESDSKKVRNLGVFRVWRKRGREYVPVALIAALRDRLGVEAEEYVERYADSICVSHLDPVGMERAIEEKNPDEI